MDSITVQIVAKRARSTWRRRVNTEFRETVLKVTSDLRVRAGLRAALEHICERNRLTKGEQHELVAALEKECVRALETEKEPSCVVTIDEWEDRIEVKVGHGRTVRRATVNDWMHATLVKHFHKNTAHS